MKLQKGFTLLEVVAALAIFALGLGSLYSLFEGSLQRSNTASSRAEALVVAKQQLEESLAFGDFQDKSGEHENYQWQIDYQNQPSDGNSHANWLLYDVEVKVMWLDKSGQRELRLVSKRIGRGNQ